MDDWLAPQGESEAIAAHHPYLRIYHRTISRQAAKTEVRMRIQALQRECADLYEHELGLRMKVAARLRNRCHQLVALHRTEDW